MSEENKRRLTVTMTVLLVLALVMTGALVLLSGGFATAKQIATLRVLTGSVDVRAGDGEPAPGSEGQSLHEGDTVLTGSDGRAAIEYFDGSVTRMDFNTAFTLTTLETIDNAESSKVIEAEQTSGNTYNRVAELTDSESRFDIETPTATASVQGTVYAIILNPDGSTTIAVVGGVVTATGSNGAVDLEAGMMVTIGADGLLGTPVPIPDDLLDSDWITFNQCDLDAIRDCVEGTTVEPEPEPEEEEPSEEEPEGETGPVGETGTEPTPDGDGDGDGIVPEPENSPPHAGFSASPGVGDAPLTLSIADTSSDPDGDALTREWDFGDGTSHSGGQQLTHTYTEPGQYALELTVTDPDGASDSALGVILVTDGTAPVVTLTSAPSAESDSADAFFAFSSSEAGTGFACSLDGEAPTGCGGSASLLLDLLARLAHAPSAVSGSVTYTGLEDGPHSFTVTVTDLAGNSGSASWDWTVDAVPDLDHITLSPSASTIEVGQSQAYSVTAFDENGNSMGDVTAAATISGAGCGGNVCSPQIAGDFTITATYQGTSDTALLHVLEPAPPAATFDHITVQPGAATITYGGSQTYSAIAIDSDGNSMGDVTADTSFTGANCTGATCTPHSAGHFDVTGSYSGSLGSDTDVASLDVNEATLTVTAGVQSRTYGAENPKLTFAYGGFVFDDGPGDLTTEPTCSTDAAETSPVGLYKITCSGGADESYAFAYVDASLSVTKATLTVTPDNVTKTYGDPDPIFTFVITGFQNDEGTKVIDTLPTCGVTGPHADVGAYPITCSGGSDDNYDFEYATGILLVTKKETLTVTADDQSKVYGDPDPAFTFKYDGFAPGDGPGVIDLPPICQVDVPHSDVGSYPIVCAGGADNNYAFSFVSGTLTVKQASLTVTPEDVTIEEGGKPEYPFDITGFRYDDGPGVIDTMPVCSAGPGPFKVGIYPITCSAGKAKNYDFIYETATLTVLSPKVEYQLLAYGPVIPVFPWLPWWPEEGQAFSAVVFVLDDDGDLVEGSGCQITIGLGDNDEGAELSGNLGPKTATGAWVVFGGLRIDEEGWYRIVASSANCGASDESWLFRIVGDDDDDFDQRGGGLGRGAAPIVVGGRGGALWLILPLPLPFVLAMRRRRR